MSAARRVLASLLLASLAACSSGGNDGNKPGAGLEDIIPHVATQAGVTAAKVCAALPAAGSGPTLDVTAPAAVLPGGSALYVVAGSGSYDTLYIAVAGTDCYWMLTVPAGTTQTVVVTVGQNAPSTFNLVFGGSSGGAAGARETIPVTLTSVGTGKVQVSVSWDVESDVDLHLQMPTGTEIYWDNDIDSATGAILDLDSNPACSIDHVKNENITFTKDPPHGTYKVLVDYYDSCLVTQTKYVVTTTVNGVTKTFSGTFTGDGDGGGQGDGVLVTSFTY
ncbi:MAG: hypothetical protein U0229_06995 [Anaeromyxobacter sp.]